MDANDDNGDAPSGDKQGGDSIIKKQESINETNSTWKGSSSNVSSIRSTSNMTEQPLGPTMERNNTDTTIGLSSSRPESVPRPESLVMASLTFNEPSVLMTSTSNARGSSSRRGSSLELRKMPVNVLLRPEGKIIDEELSLDGAEDGREMNTKGGCLQRTCLNSKFGLRSQMMLSFGTISAGTILLVVVVCIVISTLSGEVVKEKTRTTFEDVSLTLQEKATKAIAEDLTARLIMEDTIQILYEQTLDRFYGYPTADDSKVPFFDTITQTNKYPIKGQPIPLDWQIEATVNKENQDEHLHGRASLYGGDDAIVNTANAVYLMQGSCDPNVTDPTQNTYLEGCTDDNNDITTGGVHAPSPTNEFIHRKASDLTPILKSLYEYHKDVRSVDIFFSNSGAGSTISYPGTQLSSGKNYTSIGCDWLKRPHPLDRTRPILSAEDIARCEQDGRRVDGAPINGRLYSPFDRAWFKDQVLNPGQVRVNGPFVSAWAHDIVWIITIGRAVYDPITNELIASVAIHVDVHNSLSGILSNSTVTSNSQVSVAHWAPEGTVVASSAWNMSTSVTAETISGLDVGVTQSAYEEFYGLVDYGKVWNATEIKQIYEEFTIESRDFQVKAYPIPPIPEEYDKDYEPKFLVLFSVAKQDVYVYADIVDKDVDRRVWFLTILSVGVGVAGLVAVLLVIGSVSNFITRPLRRMNEIAVRIIDNFGEDSKIEVEDSTLETQGGKCQTELTEIVREFQKMVRKFSGGAMTKSEKVGVTEVDNQFQLMEDFQDLYSSREDEDFLYSIEEPQPKEAEAEASQTGRRHAGSNVLSGGGSTVRNSVAGMDIVKENRQNSYSPLFKWIVVLIVLPLLVTTITISTVVIVSVSLELPDMIQDAEDGLIVLRVSALQAFASLRAGFVGRSSEQSIRDLHVLTRFTSWLLFGGIETNAFPELITGAEDCKGYTGETFRQCPFFQENHVCDCDWNDQLGLPCGNYSNDSVDSRYLQIPYFWASSLDNEINGNITTTSFPKVAYSQNSTAYWASQHEVPGSPANVTSSMNPVGVQGPDTMYSRLRSASASTIYQTLYNYDKLKETVIGAFVSFEADGMVVAYSGCSNLLHTEQTNWVSSEQNNGAKLRPELCPLDKYGYDPRCRGWYDSGRSLYLTEDAPLFVTPPYPYAISNFIGQSCTSPLVDPITKRHLGQVLIDFVSTRIFEFLNQEKTPLANGGFPLLITTKSDSFGASDVVLGPGISVSDERKPVMQVINARQESCEESVCGFRKIVQSMKAGESRNDTFVAEKDDGTLVKYHIAYSPVNVRSLEIVDSSDFSRGVKTHEYRLYSLALAVPESSMLEPFEKTQDDIEVVIYVGLAILCTLIVIACGVLLWLSHRITVSMTEPMHYLLELIRHINRLDAGEDPPHEDVQAGYGSREVLNVRLTMEKLYKIIKCANAAYFAGETEVAYEVFTDALRLFTRLDNRKAMGIANNNLGNTMLTLYRTMDATGNETILGLSRRQIIGKGMAYFHQAIQLGEKAYDSFYETEGWSPTCLHFMQHLSNRYFNRAMFLLTVKDHHEKPTEIEELGMRDLQIARDMDVEIVDEGTQVGWDVRQATDHLEVLLCRIRGHVTLLEMGYPNNWEVGEMLEAAFEILKTELDKETTDLFEDVGPAGRMQQIEFLLMRYYVVLDDLDVAAKIAIRMLVEDEFILPDAQQKAVEVLMAYAKQGRFPLVTQKKLKVYQAWLRDAVDEHDTQRSSKEAFENTRSSFVSTMGFSKRLLDGEHKSSVASLRESTRGDVTMEAF